MEENNTKEINLLDLISSLTDWLKKYIAIFFGFLGHLLKLTYKYKFVTLALMALGVGGGFYLSREKVYKAEAMANFYGIGTPSVKEVAKQLELSNAANASISLGTKLNLPDSIAKNIVGINTFFVIDYLKNGTPDKIDYANNHSLTDTLNLVMNDRLYFQVLTKKISQVPQVQAAIENYFSRNVVLSTDFQNVRNELQAKIQICDVELKRIDSLAKVSYFKDVSQQVGFENNKLIVGEQRKQLFSSDLLNLQGIKSSALSTLEIYKKPVQFPSNFVVSPAPVNSFLKYGVYGIIIGFCLAVVLAFVLDNLKCVLNYLKSN